MTGSVLGRAQRYGWSLVAVMVVSGCYTPTGAWRGTGDFRGEDTRRETVEVDKVPSVQLARAGDDAVARFTQTSTCEDQLLGTNLVERQTRSEKRLVWPAEAIVGIGGALGFIYVAGATFGKWRDPSDFTPVLVLDGAAIALAMTYLAITPPTREITRWNRLPPETGSVPLPESRRSCGTPQAMPKTSVTAVLRFPEVRQQLTWQTKTDELGLAHFSLSRARGAIERCGTGFLELETVGDIRLTSLPTLDADPPPAPLRLPVPTEGPKLAATEAAWAELVRRCDHSRETALRPTP